MGLFLCLLAATTVILISCLLDTHGSSHDPTSLDSFFLSLADQTSVIFTHPTGTPYQIPLPSNFSGMDLSAIKFRTKSFWKQGANLTSIANVFISIPPKILPWPFVKRVIILFHTLGNWSAEYYNVPGYSLAAPVVGFNLYDSTNLTALGSHKLAFRLLPDPISLRFGTINVNQNMTAFRCVRFGEGGVVEINNMVEGNLCQTNSPGRFSILVPSTEKENIRIISLVGIVVGIFGLVVFVGGGFFWWKKRRIDKMEEESEKDDVGFNLNTFWIGDTKMPTASITRTQPVIEHTDVP